MSTLELIEKIESMITNGRVPGTTRTLVNLDKITAVLEDMKKSIPGQMDEAQTVLRQKEAILKQAELEARRIRAYADEEATTIRRLAEEQSASHLEIAREQSQQMIDSAQVARDAQDKAKEIIREAEVKGQKLILEAKQSVNGIIADAEAQAEQRRKGADNYAREVLFSLEERIADTLGQVRGGIDLLDSRSMVAAS